MNSNDIFSLAVGSLIAAVIITTITCITMGAMQANSLIAASKHPLETACALGGSDRQQACLAAAAVAASSATHAEAAQ